MARLERDGNLHKLQNGSDYYGASEIYTSNRNSGEESAGGGVPIGGAGARDLTAEIEDYEAMEEMELERR